MHPVKISNGLRRGRADLSPFFFPQDHNMPPVIRGGLIMKKPEEPFVRLFRSVVFAFGSIPDLSVFR